MTGTARITGTAREPRSPGRPRQFARRWDAPARRLAAGAPEHHVFSAACPPVFAADECVVPVPHLGHGAGRLAEPLRRGALRPTARAIGRARSDRRTAASRLGPDARGTTGAPACHPPAARGPDARVARGAPDARRPRRAAPAGGEARPIVPGARQSGRRSPACWPGCGTRPTRASWPWRSTCKATVNAAVLAPSIPRPFGPSAGGVHRRPGPL